MTIRPAGPEDRDPVVAMFGRCSAATLYQRFHTPVTRPPARYLDWVLAPGPKHLALVAQVGGEVVGIAEAHRGQDGIVEVALVVEDAWQRRSLGVELFGALLGGQRRLGVRTVRATVLTEHRWLVRRLTRLDRATVTMAGTTCDIVIPLTRHDRRRAAPRSTACAGRAPSETAGELHDRTLDGTTRGRPPARR